MYYTCYDTCNAVKIHRIFMLHAHAFCLQLRFIIDLLGPPPDHLLDAGRHSKKFFKKSDSDQWMFMVQYLFFCLPKCHPSLTFWNLRGQHFFYSYYTAQYLHLLRCMCILKMFLLLLDTWGILGIKKSLQRLQVLRVPFSGQNEEGNKVVAAEKFIIFQWLKKVKRLLLYFTIVS